MTKASHMIKVEVIIGTLRTLDMGVTINVIVTEVNINEVIEGNLRIEQCHMTEAKAGIQMIIEDLGEAEETVDLEIEINLALGTKVRREGVIAAESQYIL